MLNRLIRFSLDQRAFVLWLAAGVLLAGILVVSRLDVDVFPDLNRPTVTIFAEAPGLAPEEIESLVVFPIEAAVNGATRVTRVRSVSAVGLGLVYVEFAWGSDIYVDRQVVTERLQLAASRLPPGVVPVLGPISSLMGEIELIALRSQTGAIAPPDLRTLADWTIRPRLLGVTGVAQVTAMGGGVKQLQVLVAPEKLRQLSVTLHHVEVAAAQSNLNSTGGYLEQGTREFLIQNLGRVRTPEDLAQSIVASRGGVPVRLGDVARVAYGVQVMRGDGGVNGHPAVVMSVQKQPGVDTGRLTARVDQALTELARSLPPDVQIERNLFRQADFIGTAVSNVTTALRDGSVIVAVVLLVFLLNIRTTFITLTAIPISLLVAALVMGGLGLSVNTMTLGGLAVALGQIVDDAIVDVENVHRRLRENRNLPQPRPALDVIFAASSEIRNSITYATVIVILAFVPLFFLSGIEGRLFTPLGVAYVVSILASLVVSLTLTPALCAYLLPAGSLVARRDDSPLVTWLKRQDARLVRASVARPRGILAGALVAFVVSIALVPLMGREFLPPFNEGTVTVNLVAAPGLSLAESNRLGVQAEQLLLKVPGVAATGRRTGRAELDEHAEGVNYTEIEVGLAPGAGPRDRMIDAIRRQLSTIAGVDLNIGQPISHRLEHLLSGTEAQIAIKLFGPDLSVLMERGTAIEAVARQVDGVVDVSIEKEAASPRVHIEVDRQAASRYGLQVGEINETLETALSGRTVSQLIAGDRRMDVIVRLDERYRHDVPALGDVTIDGPNGTSIPVSSVARISPVVGPNQIRREDGQRRVVVQANVSGRDLAGAVADLRRAISSRVTLPPGYVVTYGGQFESQERATRLLLWLSAFAVLGVFIVLLSHFGSAALALQIMANIPLAIIGGVIAVFLSGGTLSVASLVGFITLAGIAVRNGIMMISHYLHLVRHEGEQCDDRMIVRGSLERLVPVLMTALTGSLGLLPLAFAGERPGAEILQPIAVVILGGLISSTLLDQAVTPALFRLFGRRACQAAVAAPAAGEYP